MHCFTITPTASATDFQTIATATGGLFVNGGSTSQVRRGDVNGDTRLNVLDVILMLEYMIYGNNVACCPQAADVNNSSTVALNDAILLMNFIFTNGPPPAAPFPDCGPGNTAISSQDCISTCP